MMKNKIKLFAQIDVWLLLIALLWLAMPTNAQHSQSNQKAIPKTIQKPIPDGYTIIDGDIVVPNEFVEAISDKQNQSSNAPEATFRTNTWSGGIVPFEFQITNVPASNCNVNSGAVSAANQAVMIGAMAVLEEAANVDFRQCAGASCPNGNRILVRDTTNDVIRDGNNNCINGAANNSPVGMVGGQQIINIVSWNSQFIIIHELLHALGFYHEQSRPDRDNFVQVNCNNVQGGCGGTLFNNFVIKDDATAYGYYDFDSLMHYGQCTFTAGANCPTDGTQTITVKAPFNAQWQNAIGQRTHLSALDRATLSFLYPVADWRFLDCTYNEGNGFPIGTFSRPHNRPANALVNMPVGGTLWVLTDCSFPAGTYSKQMTIRTAPGVTATFGN